MKPEELRDRLVDVLLSESVGKQSPPDVRERVLQAVNALPEPSTVDFVPRPVPVPLQSAKRSRVPALAIAALLALLLGGGVFLQAHRVKMARTPMLVEASGKVDRVGGALGPGESLTTGPGSAATLRYQDGTVVMVAADTRVMVMEGTTWDRSKRIRVMSGQVSADVMPQPDDHPLTFVSTDARCEVVGTLLSFQVAPERSRLEVQEGSVRFIGEGGGRRVLVDEGCFAEAGRSGFKHGRIPAPARVGIVGFTLMNAETDMPIRDEPLVSGEVISLSSLPTKKINIRADFEGEPPVSVRIDLRRRHGHPTGLPPHSTDLHMHPPYFVAGDHWGDGRPEDCAEWTPPLGFYELSAEAIYADAEKSEASRPMELEFQISR